MPAKHALSIATTALLLGTCAPASAAESVIGIRCEEDGIGARIYLNGEYRGDCPIKLFADPGDVTLRVVKPEGDEHERVYEETFYLPGDSFKTMRIELSAPQLTAEARIQRSLSQLAKERHTANVALEKARAGDIEAMEKVANYYQGGYGFTQSDSKSKYWQQAAAKAKAQRHANELKQQAAAGDVEAMKALAILYQQGQGVPKDASQAQVWSQKAQALEAKAAFEAAQNGDIEAMQQLSGMYSAGVGVEKDPAKAQEWQSKADAARQARAQAQENENIQAKIDEISYFSNTVAVANWYGEEFVNMDHMNTEDDGWNLTVGTIYMGSFLPFLPTGLVGDSVEAPTKISELNRLKKQLATRPAGFINRDSMIARAMHSKQ